jgi:hypothetical protein
MFEKIGRLAETAATNISLSRRGFLSGLGQAALGAAGVLGGLLVLPGAAQAGGSVVCCRYQCKKAYACRGGNLTVCIPAGSTCLPSAFYGMCGCIFQSQTSKSECSRC